MKTIPALFGRKAVDGQNCADAPAGSQIEYYSGDNGHLFNFGNNPRKAQDMVHTIDLGLV